MSRTRPPSASLSCGGPGRSLVPLVPTFGGLSASSAGASDIAVAGRNGTARGDTRFSTGNTDRPPVARVMPETPFERQILIERQRLREQGPEPAARGPSSEPGRGRAFWRAGKMLLGALLISSGLASAAMLWVLFGPSQGPGRSHQDTVRAEAAIPASPPPASSGNAAGPLRPHTAANEPSEPGVSPASAAGQGGPAEQTRAEAPAAASQLPPIPAQPQPTQVQAQPIPAQPQPVQSQPKPGQTQFQPVAAQARPVMPEARDRYPGAGQQQALGSPADQHAGMQCRADLCAATYKSFNAADCTYQPFGGGARSVCELGKGPADMTRQVSHAPNSVRAATPAGDAISAPDETQMEGSTQDTAEAAAPGRGGSQCNPSLCAATYKSFHAADCTYQPEGGGPRRICER